MDAAWQNHNPADCNVDIDILATLGMTVEATRVPVAHVLRISGDAIRVEWRPTATFDPTMARYTAHRVSTQDREPPIPGNKGKKARGTLDSGPSRHVARGATPLDSPTTT